MTKINFSKVGSFYDLKLRRDLLVSKYLSKNSFTIPICKRMRILFPLYESKSILLTKSVVLMIEFLEQISGLRAIIKKANLIVGRGLWVRGQVDISTFYLSKFSLFLNEIILSHPLLRFSSRLPVIRVIKENYVKLILFDIDFFFDPYTKKDLPQTKFYWLEFDFFFENKFELIGNTSIFFYSQVFFSHKLLEWRNQ